MIKENRPVLRQAIEEWLLLKKPHGTEQPADWEEITKGHGRLEKRRLWIVPCEPDMKTYLEARGWPGVQWCGWIERKREMLASGQVEAKTHIWVAGAAFQLTLTAEQAATLLRHHWEIENGVFYVRDVSMGEDQFHGRKIGHGLSGIRNAALNFLRTLGAPYIPDARRFLSACQDLGLHLLLR